MGPGGNAAERATSEGAVRSSCSTIGLARAVLLVLLALTLNLAGNGRTGLWDRDEPRYAVCVREMRGEGRLDVSDLQWRAALS